jgi:hypothetical protein
MPLRSLLFEHSFTQLVQELHYSPDIFEVVHYNKKPGVDHSLRGPECSASDLIMPVELPKYVISEGTKAVTKVTSADVILSLALYEILLFQNATSDIRKPRLL